jgi:dsDNA-specific endonuclease/ATPase MutS2
MKGGAMEILALLDKLESTVSTSARLPGTHKTLVDARQMLDLVDQLRLSVPKDIRQSQEMLAQREAIVNQALLEARRVKASAQEESRTQVMNSTIVKEAEAKAEETLAEAKRRADALVQDAQRKAHEVMQGAQHFSDDRITDSNNYTKETLFRLEQQLASVRRLRQRV